MARAVSAVRGTRRNYVAMISVKSKRHRDEARGKLQKTLVTTTVLIRARKISQPLTNISQLEYFIVNSKVTCLELFFES